MPNGSDDAFATAALYLGGGAAGYAAGRWLIARRTEQRDPAARSSASAVPTTSMPEAANPPLAPFLFLPAMSSPTSATPASSGRPGHGAAPPASTSAPVTR